LVSDLAALDGLEDISLTTNGLLLREHALSLRKAGLNRITMSLDTIRPDRYRALNGGGTLERALDGLDAIQEAGFKGTKLNTVVMSDVNDDELVPLLTLGQRTQTEVRFIEYMDVGGATNWKPSGVVSQSDILKRLEDHYGPIARLKGRGSAPAARYQLPSGQTFGIIASTTTPFCRSCDRSRLTADGRWLLCLYDPSGIVLRAPLRAGRSDAQLETLIHTAWTQRTLRGAESRVESAERGAWVSADVLSQNPHLEMHTRGG